MVVTRRTPAAPVPASRNPSTQPIPRIAKKPNPDTPSVPDKPSPLSNGSTVDATNRATDVDADKETASATSKSAKLKGKQKSKKGGKKKSSSSTSFTEFVFRLFLLWFTIYTLAVCPEDEQLRSPVCRGLAHYRALVIEPYFLPPIQHALAHPSVTPYVEKARPYADYALRTARPVAARVHKEFDARVVPQWNKRVVPLYHKYAVPQLLKLDAQTAPYRTRVEKEYEQFLAPYVRRTASTLYQLQEQARPYVVLTAQKTYQGYQAARPYARPLWEKIKVVSAQVAALLGEQRRQFVDPHVQKIWEHVKEMSSGKPPASPASPLSKTSSQVSKASTEASVSLSSASSSTASISSAISSSVAQVTSSAISEAVSSSKVPPVSQPTETPKSSVAEADDRASSVVSSLSDALKSTASVISEPAPSTISSGVSVASDAPAASLDAEAQSVVRVSVDSVSSVAQEIPSAASSPVGSVTTAAYDAANEALSSVAHAAVTSLGSSDVPSATTSIADAPVADPAGTVSSAVGSASTETQHDEFDLLFDPDLDAFKAELGLSEEDLLSDPVEQSGPAEPHVETEEELEAQRKARLEKTARDRAELDIRHAKWEGQLAELIQTNKKALRKALVALRKAAVVELKDDENIRSEIDSLIEDGEKFLRGAEKYLANLRKESRKIEEKRTIWDRIVGKVEQKFNDRLHQTEAVVNGWYQTVLDNEATEVDKVTGEVKDFAERAQADIGLDYAYLDDVTYHDWQRYHDLIRKSENFTVHARSVQDGTHPSPPINPVIAAIKELQDEVDDVISGFNARLRKIKRSGARVFGSADAGDEEEESASILPVEDPEHSEVPAEAGAPPMTIGRGKEEVEAALNRVAEADAGKTSSRDEQEQAKDAEAVAQSLSEEVASETRETSDASPLHQEL